MSETPDRLLAEALRRDASGPLLTFYDDETGERSELSAATLANWVAKTANLITDEFGVAPGDRVAVLLPAHWQTAAVLLALWTVGATVGTGPRGSALVVADEPHLATALSAGAPGILGLSLAPMNAPLRDPAPGVVDYAAEVLAAGDVYVGGPPSGHEEVAAARRRAAELGLSRGDRVLVVDASGTDDAVDWLLTPFAAGASLVLCRHTDPALVTRRAASERVTVTLPTGVHGT